MTTRPTIYLGGPIFGLAEGDAKNWRRHVADQLEAHGINAISPLRCEPAVNGKYELSYPDPCFGHAKAILGKNFLDVRRCDFALFYFPERAENQQLSIGTTGELSWCYALRKPSCVVTTDPLAANHPFTSLQPDWPILPTLDDAVRLITGLYSGYILGGRNV